MAELKYTEPGRRRMEMLIASLRTELEQELQRRRYVPGDEVEITGSDVAELEHDVRLVLRRREALRDLQRKLIVSTYIAAGIVAIFVGLFYDVVMSLVASPVRLSLIAVGIVMTYLGVFLRAYFHARRDKDAGPPRDAGPRT